MKAFLQFDATVGAYDIQSQLYMVGALKGVNGVELLRRTLGDGPQYCIEIEAEESAMENLARQAEGARGQFAGYISNVTFSAYVKA